ncbi:MAG: hypothetical protein ABEJ34_04010 [Haloferacaceae archaeon]
MTLTCDRCGSELADRPIRSLLRIDVPEGHVCPDCGACLCEECYRARRAGPSSPRDPDRCLTCGGTLESRGRR